MKSLAAQLESSFRRALVQLLGDEGRTVDPLIRVSTDEQFGDYQSNVAMGLGKRLSRKPREVAQQLVDVLQQDAAARRLVESFEIAGPGFINIRLGSTALADLLSAIPAAGDASEPRTPVRGPRLASGVPISDARPQRVVVDYSGPNIAKQLHVGHIRSTIIGDAIARVLEFEGHEVIRQNHIGDWGTQFGMLCAYLKEKFPAALEQPEQVHLADLEEFYKAASSRDKEDPAFAERARAEVVALHRHEPSTLRAWQYIVDESRNHYMPIYQRLGAGLTREHERGESFYSDRLPDVVRELQRQFGGSEPSAAPGASGGIKIHVRDSDGALCIFHYGHDGEPLFKSPEGEPFPMIIRKSDGAYLYATTDLAALRFRIRELNADRIIYVTDARQVLHFQMLLAAVRAAGWTLPPGRSTEIQLEHITFGSILGEDRKPLKSRSGENIKLADLLDEAVARAEKLIRDTEADAEKRRGFSEAEIKDVAEAVGIGAVKYADLAQNRQSDYVFSWDKMLAMEGNTAPYLMYAYARIRSIHRKGAAGEPAGPPAGTGERITLDAPAERILGRQILRFAETLEGLSESLRPNLLTDYLYQLAVAFMKFYETCPVLAADTPDLRASRLKLCDLTARTLHVGLGLLGIRVVERM